VSPDTSGGDFQYLKLTKGGRWLYGSDEEEVSDDSVFVFEPSSYAQGYVAWADGVLLGEFMAVTGTKEIALADLPELPVKVDSEGDAVKWKPQKAFALKGIEGAEEGVQLVYKTSSGGGLKAISGLLAAIVARGMAGNVEIYPEVLLDSSSYKHKIKKYGTIYTPVLTVDKWVEGPTSEGEGEGEAHVKEEPKKAIAPPAKKTRTRKPAPEPEEASGEEEWDGGQEADPTDDELDKAAAEFLAEKAEPAPAAKTPRTRRTRKTG
jgi:hypothetical protein